MVEIDHHKHNFIRIISEILPSTISKLENIIDERNAFQTTLKVNDGYDFSIDGFAISTGNLISIVDAFKALAKHLHKVEEDTFVIHAFPRSTNALVRLALENIAYFKWLNLENDDRDLNSKAFSFLLRNAEEGKKYYADLADSTNAEKLSLELDKLIRIGLDLGYLAKDEEGSQKFKLTRNSVYPPPTELCSKILTLEDYPVDQKKEILNNYPGLGNASFIYRYLSGHIHGYQWVTKFENSKVVPLKQEIIYWIPNLALMAVVREINQIEV